jgi:hypothetical protein
MVDLGGWDGLHVQASNSSSVDLVIEELDLLSGGVAGSLADRELEATRLGEEINLLISELPRAEIAASSLSNRSPC